MKTPLVLVGLLLMAGALAQQRSDVHPKGVIYGVAIGQDGQAAKGIALAAFPLGLKPGEHLPQTRANQAGEYRFENLGLGRYTVYAKDDEVGYSELSTGRGGADPDVELTPEHRRAEVWVYLPPRAGFLQVRLTNRSTGADIPTKQIALMSAENPDSPLFIISSRSNRAILIPPDKSLLLHVTSDGFHEWEESMGMGKPIYLPSGTRLTLDVQLDPVRD